MKLLVEKKQKEDILSYVKSGKKISIKKQLRLVIYLSVPSILAQIASIIMQYIDASMVGRLGTDGSAAIGLVSSTTWLFGSMCIAITAGFSVQFAQYIGANKNEDARDVLRQSITSVLLFSLLLAVIGISISGLLPELLAGDVKIRKSAETYFFIYSCFLPAVGMNSLAGSMLQCSGNMKIPSLLNVLMCVLDVIFNAVLIFPTYSIRVF